jgi:GTP-sensing pleiotropic transcriptional regulator CodY
MTTKYSPCDLYILEILEDGRNVAANIAKKTGYTRQYVFSRLKYLEAAGRIRNIGAGLYELIAEEEDNKNEK